MTDKLKCIWKGEEYPMQEYLDFWQETNLRNSLGILSWMTLSAFTKRLEGAKVKGLPKLEVWCIKDEHGIWLDYPHGAAEVFYPPYHNKENIEKLI